MSDPAIAGIGAYTPRFRIDAATIERALGRFEVPGVEEKAVPEADEDALTMALAATERALAAAGRDAADVAHLAFATTTPPMAEEDLTARLASFLGVSGAAHTATLTGSTRAGGQALDAALDAGPWGEAVGVVVASDCPRGAPDSPVEQGAGAGAAALVLGDSGTGTVENRASHAQPFPGTRFREGGTPETTGLGVSAYDRRAFRTVLADAADRLDADTGSVDAAAIRAPDGELPYRAADAVGVDAGAVRAAETVSTLGDTGAASPLLGLARAVDDGAGRVLLAAYGSGAGANLAVVSDLDDVPAIAAFEGTTELTYPEYLRRRGTITRGEPEGGGAYVSVPAWQRTIPQRHRLVAGRCRACGALAFPPDGACRACHERPDAFESVRLPGTGTVEAETTIRQGGAPPEFVEQQARSGPFVSAVVAFDGPEGEESASAPVQVVGTDDVTVGTQVETTVRRVYQQEGVVRYSRKAVPAADRR